VSAIAACVLGGCVVASPVSAQTLPGNPWSHGTTLQLLAGGASAPSVDARPAFGCAMGWEINHWVSIEGGGAWLVGRSEDDAFAAELKAAVNLTRPNRAVPYVGAGIGLYRATFDEPPTMMPPFYARRMAASMFGSRSTFTDPSFVFAGGVNVFTTRHISIRPDMSVRLVAHDGDTYAVTIAAVHLIYHFEVHDAGR